MPSFLVFIVLGGVGLLVVLVAGVLIGGRSNRGRQGSDAARGLRSTDTSSGPDPFLTGMAAGHMMHGHPHSRGSDSSGTSGGDVGIHGTHHGAHHSGSSTQDYSTNNFSGPDPASDAGVSFGDSGGGFDSGGGGGGDSGGGGGGDGGGGGGGGGD